MQFDSASSSRRSIKSRRDFGDQKYPHNLQMYFQPPGDIVSLDEFEDMAVERLQVLRGVERISLIGTAKKPEEIRSALINQLRNLNLDGYVKLLKPDIQLQDITKAQEDAMTRLRRKDHTSHWILRLAFCRSEELRRWFIQQEVELFKCRFHLLSAAEVNKFLESNNLFYKPISDKEKKSAELEKGLRAALGGVPDSKYDDLSFFCVPFTEALDLVRTRHVFIKKGFAYVPHTEILSIVLTIFRTRLSQALVVTSRALPTIEDDIRLVNILHDFEKKYAGEDFTSTNSGSVVTADMLDNLAMKSFPPCMRHLHESCTTAHHLKHGGRMQYGLFLKGIGLPLEESLKFFRKEFTQVMDIDKFDKQYAYNVRHNYGKEGKRCNYTPYGCMKIIQSTVSVGDSHGCPFRHCDQQTLKNKLKAWKVKQTGVDEIVELAKEAKYQIACSKYFSYFHGVEDVLVQHPNQYYAESVTILSGERASINKGLSNVKTTKSVVYSQSNEKQKKEVDDWNDELSEETLSAMLEM